jgi:electron transfer flavoprotein alpha subunit
MSDVFVVAEHRRGDLRDVSLELVEAGRQLADQTGGDLRVAQIGGQLEQFTAQLDRHGVDVIHTVDNGEEFNHDVYAQVVEQLLDAVDPQFLLGPQSVNGQDYLPAVARRTGRPIVTDAIDLSYDETLAVTREQYGSKVETTVELGSDRGVVTIRPGEWPRAEGTGDATIESFEADIDERAVGSTVKGFEEAPTGDVDISEADFLIAVGRGIEEEENLDLIRDLVDATGATLASSRPIVDNDWLPANRQVGQSGKVVSPDVYIAIGISGAVQHVAGIKGADTIIAINDDPDAPIFDVADYGIVDDLFDVVPALIEQFS